MVLAESMDKHEQADGGYEDGDEEAAGGLASDEDSPAPEGSAPSGPASRRLAGRSTLSRSVDAAGLAFGGVSWICLGGSGGRCWRDGEVLDIEITGRS